MSKMRQKHWRQNRARDRAADFDWPWSKREACEKLGCHDQSEIFMLDMGDAFRIGPGRLRSQVQRQLNKMETVPDGDWWMMVISKRHDTILRPDCQDMFFEGHGVAFVLEKFDKVVDDEKRWKPFTLVKWRKPNVIEAMELAVKQ